MGKTGAAGSEQVPQAVADMRQILKAMGVTSYDPAVVTQLLEFSHRKYSLAGVIFCPAYPPPMVCGPFDGLGRLHRRHSL